MPLPASSGPISASNVGDYVFDRGTTAEFSLSASLAGTTVNKGYNTTLGPLWRGNGVSDVNNQQYNQGANNFALSDWYGYWKGIGEGRTDRYRNNPDGACADNTQADTVYYTDGRYYNGGAGAENEIYNNSTVAYTNTSGTSTLAGTSIDYYKIISLNRAYTTDANGVFDNEYIC